MGRLTKDPEPKQTQSQKSYSRFVLAVDRKGKDSGADFIPCLAWGGTGEFIQKYFTKGSKIGITGRIETGSYDDKDGKRVNTTVIVVETVDFADSKKENVITDEDLPF